MNRINSLAGSSCKDGFTCDKILKSVLNDPMLMAQLFLLYVLPDGYADTFDFSAMTLLPNEHIDPTTRRYFFNDMGWKLPLRDTSYSPSYIVVMLELQSTTVYKMPIRTLNYKVQHYQELASNDSTDSDSRLPYAHSLVLYTGLRPWKGPEDIQTLISEPPVGEWKDTYVEKHKFQLLNAKELEVKGDANSLIAQFIRCLKWYRNDEKMPKWRDIVNVLHKAGRDAKREAWWQLYCFMFRRNVEEKYMSNATTAEIVYPRATEQDAEAIDAYLDGGEFPSQVAPFGAYLIREARKKGRQEGREEGRQEGREEGMAKGKAVTMADMIAWRYAECAQEIVAQVRDCVDQDLLERVGKALLTTTTYEGFLKKAQL